MVCLMRPGKQPENKFERFCENFTFTVLCGAGILCMGLLTIGWWRWLIS